jgi:SAM-dependent methyltransferase
VSVKNSVLYDKYADGRHWDKHPTVYAEHFADILAQRNFRGLIVDVGCGCGRDVNVFGTRGFEVVGLDNSRLEVERARDSFPFCFIPGDIEALPFAEEEVGAFFAINVIHYVDPVFAFQQFKRKLRPGGLLFIHFNLRIVAADGQVDLVTEGETIEALSYGWICEEERIFKRVDALPREHTHTVMEKVLRKPE